MTTSYQTGSIIPPRVLKTENPENPGGVCSNDPRPGFPGLPAVSRLTLENKPGGRAGRCPGSSHENPDKPGVRVFSAGESVTRSPRTPITIEVGQRWIVDETHARTILQVFPQTATREASVQFVDQQERKAVTALSAFRQWLKRMSAELAE